MAMHQTQHGVAATLQGYMEMGHRIATEATGIGNGAIGTEVVTTVLHLQEIAGAIASRTGRCKGLDVLRLHRLIGLARPSLRPKPSERDCMSLAFSLAPNTRSTPSILLTCSGFNWA